MAKTIMDDVEKVLTLNSLEEFELWLESLTVFFSRDGRPVESKRPISPERSFRGELQSSLKVLSDLVERCPQVLKDQVTAETPDLSMEWGVGNELKSKVLEHERLGPQLRGFIDLWDYLQRCKTVGVSMTRHRSLSLAEFRAFGYILASQIEVYKSSEAYNSLFKREQYSKYYHIIHRDILAAIEIEGTREELERIFVQFFRVLSTVEYFRTMMRRSFRYQQLTILLTYCHFSYSNFLAILDQAQHYLAYCRPDLSEAVSLTRSALKMETRRIFGQEIQGITSQQKLEAIYAQMETALGLLKHASQQSFTSLVQQLNPNFDQFSLFEELRRQRSDSQQLLVDLQELHRIAMAPETQHSEDGYSQLLKVLDRFQKGSMRTLYFKDWQPFEQFTEELRTSEDRERAFVLHRLEVYVSTLIGEVGKRFILRSEEAAEGQETTADHVGHG